MIGEGCTLGLDVSIYCVNHPPDFGIQISQALEPSRESKRGKGAEDDGAPAPSVLDALVKGLRRENLLLYGDRVEIGE